MREGNRTEAEGSRERSRWPLFKQLGVAFGGERLGCSIVDGDSNCFVLPHISTCLNLKFATISIFRGAPSPSMVRCVPPISSGVGSNKTADPDFVGLDLLRRPGLALPFRVALPPSPVPFASLHLTSPHLTCLADGRTSEEPHSPVSFSSDTRVFSTACRGSCLCPPPPNQVNLHTANLENPSSLPLHRPCRAQVTYIHALVPIPSQTYPDITPSNIRASPQKWADSSSRAHHISPGCGPNGRTEVQMAMCGW